MLSSINIELPNGIISYYNTNKNEYDNIYGGINISNENNKGYNIVQGIYKFKNTVFLASVLFAMM